VFCANAKKRTKRIVVVVVIVVVIVINATVFCGARTRERQSESGKREGALFFGRGRGEEK